MPKTGRRTFFIAGAGISGLTLALALAKFGANVTVLERNASVSEFGAGLQISPNARRVLDRLGLDEAITANSLEPTGIDLYPPRAKRPLVTLELGAIMRERFGAPYAVMHRADLAEVLHKATRRFANIDILYGTHSWDAVASAHGIALAVEDASGQIRSLRGDALIGADGVHSKTRTTLVGGPPATWRGRVAWRTLLPFDALASHIALDRVSVLFAANYHIVCYPLPHRQQVNIALFAAAASRDELPDQGAPRLPRRLPARARAILSAAGQSWTPWPLYTVDTPVWHQGNIGLIGDAAHAMVPFQAQGAAMGIEDAAVLAPLLIEEPSAEAAFTKFEQIRRPRVEQVARVSQANGRIFHLRLPLSLGRNLVIAAQGSRGHLKRLAWLYGHDAQP
ncbi:salicylate hydroxylase [Devosia yakushimensis]|uniref:Salicylate hydroxylase n=1 Tax=Devosia yakushimensis TaxID=470028 RepID=A0ABQ5UAG9_9HYPH|nr:FAD-dependent monooxygenase [Devosia yakushimensis]GLQ09127.1 salicylate hydroxylase [Devosia yakushimensis]